MKSKITLSMILLLFAFQSYAQSNSIDSLILKTGQKSISGDTRGALKYITKAIKENDQNPKLYCTRGLLYASAFRDFKSAYQDFDKAISIDPENGEYYYFRGSASKELKNFDQSYLDLKKAFKLMPANGYSSVTVTKLVENINSSLSETHQKAKQISDQGFAKLKEGDYQNSIVFFDKAIKIDSNYFAPYVYRGIANQVLKNIEIAFIDYQKAVSKNEFSDLALFGLGEIQYNKGQYQSAVQNLTMTLSYRPDNQPTLNLLGLALFKVGQPSQACDLWLKSKNLGNKQADNYIIKLCK